MTGTVLDSEYIKTWKAMALGYFILVTSTLHLSTRSVLGKNYTFFPMNIKLGCGTWNVRGSGMMLLSRCKSHHIDIPPLSLTMSLVLFQIRVASPSWIIEQRNKKCIHHSHFHKWEINVCCWKPRKYCYYSVTYPNSLLQWFTINSGNAERWRMKSNRKKSQWN